MTRRDPPFTYARALAARREPPRSWVRFWLRIAIIVTFGALVGAMLMGKI